MPLSASTAPKNAFNASIPPAEAPTPTIGNGLRARAEKSTGAEASSGNPEGVGARSDAGPSFSLFTMESPKIVDHTAQQCTVLRKRAQGGSDPDDMIAQLRLPAVATSAAAPTLQVLECTHDPETGA